MVFVDWARVFPCSVPTPPLVTSAVGAVLRLGCWSVLLQPRFFDTVFSQSEKPRTCWRQFLFQRFGAALWWQTALFLSLCAKFTEDFVFEVSAPLGGVRRREKHC